VVPFILRTTVAEEALASLKIAPLVEVDDIPLNVPKLKSTVAAPLRATNGFVKVRELAATDSK
jgi:hypothetical protein